MKKVLKAYAKINLRLKVINTIKYNNETFHNLEMINRKIKLYDKVIVEKFGIDTIEYIYNKNIKDLNINPDDDIILKALKYFKKRYAIKDFYKLTIYRNIPIGSGLGALSSIIAEIFKYFNDLYRLRLSKDELIEIGMIASKDVPYMYYNKMCVVRGMGEKVIPIKDELKESIIVIYPNLVVSTKKVFEKVNITNNEVNITNYSNDYIYNDLENITLKLYPELINVKTYLLKYKPIKLVMTGSGSSFVMLVDKKNLNSIYAQIEKETNYFIYKERI